MNTPSRRLRQAADDASAIRPRLRAHVGWRFAVANADGTPAVWVMNGTNVVAGANAGADPGASWHVIPQHHDLV